VNISDVEIDGFGVWRRLRLSGITDQLTVIYGPNEAGKSTLLQFMRAVLYGFSPERRARFLPPVDGGRAGGSLQLRTVAGALTVARFDSPVEGGADAIISARPGGPPSGRSLVELLGGVDEPTFNHVFALGLREMQQLGTLTDSQAAHWLYELTLGVDHVSLADVMERLDAWREQIISPEHEHVRSPLEDEQPAPNHYAHHPTAGPRFAQVQQLVARRDQLKSEIEELRELTVRYFESAESQRHLAAAVEALQQADAALERRLWLASMARSLADKWHARTALGRQLEALGNIEPLPEGSVERFNQLRARQEAFGLRVNKLRQRRAQLKQEALKVEVNEALCRQAPRLEALSEQQQWITFLGEQTHQLEEEIAKIELQHEAEKKKWVDVLGKRADGKLPNTTPRHFENMMSTARQLKSHRRELVEAREAADQHKRKAKDSHGAMVEAIGDKPMESVSDSLARVGELVANLRRRIQIDERLDLISRKLKDLESHSQELLERQILPGWVIAAQCGFFAIGGMFFLAGGLAAVQLVSSSLAFGMPLPTMLLGLFIAGIVSLLKYNMDTNSDQQVLTAHNQMRSLQNERKTLTDERDALDAKLPRGGGALVARLNAAEKELAELEKLVPLEGHHEKVKSASVVAKQRHDAAHQAHRDSRGRWRKALREGGLPETLTPRQVQHYRRHVKQRQALDDRLTELRGRAEDRRREYDSLCQRISQLAAEVGWKGTATDPLAKLRELLADLHAQKGKLDRRETLNTETRTAHRRLHRCMRRLVRARSHADRLLADLRLENASELEWRVEQLHEADRLRGEIATISTDILAAIHGRASESEIKTVLDGDIEPAKLEVQINKERAAGRSRLEQLFEQRGQVREQLKSLAADNRLTERQVELSSVEARLEKAIERWQVIALSSQVLETVREVYERERQPAALREASTYLRRLTGGRYRRVWTPLGHRVLRVDDAQGRSLPVEVLSRGTREQLFLSLRLAILRAYAEQGIRLPLVLDDVLVNFDHQRAKAAAIMLREFAQDGHQVLVFTCHEHIAQLFRSLKADVRQLPDRPGGPVTVFEEPEVPEPEPEPEPLKVAVASEPVFEPLLERAATPVAFEPQLVMAVSLPEEPAYEVLEMEPVSRPAVAVRPRARHAKSPLPPPARMRRRRGVTLERWSGEEFEGELTDRVNNGVTWDEIVGPQAVVHRDGETDEHEHGAAESNGRS
jgi:uncharacterized protein YhaN